MACFRCGSSTPHRFAQRRGGWGGISRAAARYAKARLRDAGQLAVAPDWRRRLAVCRSCSLRVLADGEAYCGRPLWQRSPLSGEDDGESGCGCRLMDKARDPEAHCPLGDSLVGRNVAAEARGCACKWCRAE